MLSRVPTSVDMEQAIAMTLLEEHTPMAVIQPARRSNIAYPAKTDRGTGTTSASDGC